MTTTASGSEARISATTARFIVSGYGGSPGARTSRIGPVRVGGRVAGDAGAACAEVGVVRRWRPWRAGGRRCRASVRTVAGRKRPGAAHPRPGGRTGVSGVEAGHPGRRAAGPAVVTSRDPDPGGDRARSGGVVKVTTTSSGPTLMSSGRDAGVGVTPRAAGRAAGPTGATGHGAARPGGARSTGGAHPLVEVVGTAGRGGPGAPTRRDGGRRCAPPSSGARLPGEIARGRGPGRRTTAQRGTLPCLRWGSCSRLVRSMSRDRARTRRVSHGSMTSST